MATPLYVTKALAAAAESDEVDMLNQAEVSDWCNEESPRAAAWIDKADVVDYREALSALNEYLSDQADDEIPVITEDTDYYDNSQNYGY